MNGVRNSKYFWDPPPGALGRGPKGQISFNFNNRVNFKDFLPNFVYVLTNERYKTYQTKFLFFHLVHGLGVGLGGA